MAISDKLIDNRKKLEADSRWPVMLAAAREAEIRLREALPSIRSAVKTAADSV